MTTAYTSLLGLALPVTGELSGTWGDTVNNSITSLLDTSVAGTTNVSADSNVTLTTTSGASNQARQAILLFSGARTAIRTVTAPAQSKIYTVINATTGGFAVQLVGVGPTTGVTIVAGESAVCAWNGSDFVKVSNTGGSAVFTTLDVTNLDVTNIRALDGTAAASIANSTGVISFVANPILSGGTANGVLYLNGSKVVTSGSALTFDGANIIVNATTPAYFTGTSNLAQVSINRSPSTGAIFNASQSAAYLNIDGASGGSSFQFVVASAANTQPSEAMRLTSTGLGIGTSSPTRKLDVRGGVSFQDSAGEKELLIANDTTLVRLFSRNRSDTSDVPMAFYTGATERLRIDASGNLGLGVTPSAWGSTFAGGVFQAKNASVMGYLNAVYLGANYYATNSSDNYIATGFASRYQQTSGQHQWLNAPSGTAGNAITFTQAMTLDASGNLGIGTTSPAVKLQVQGAASSNPEIRCLDGTVNSQWYAASDGTCVFGTYSNHPLVWRTNGTEHARINSSGELLVGTAGGGIAKLYAVAASGQCAQFDSPSGSTQQGIGRFNNSTNGGYVSFAGVGASSVVPTWTNGSMVMEAVPFSTGNLILGTFSGAITFQTNSRLERARIDSSGNLLVGTTTAEARFTIGGTATSAANNTICRIGTTDYTTNTVLSVAPGVVNFDAPGVAGGRMKIDSSGGFTVGTGAGISINAQPQYVDSVAWNGAATAIYVGKSNGTGRSLNLAGTVNINGLDYAEYMTKSGDFTVAKGDVVGIDANGKLTNVFANAISFVVKSTSPSYVGGDGWGIGLEGEELEEARKTVDRIAFCGQVPVNVTGATAGQYIIPVNDNGSIKGQAVSNPTFEQYQSVVGKVIAIEADGRARIIVKLV